ncbi:RagB/SusD family nutrient uptake outer membrane protein [Bacteroides thetaiotaomicron]|uniref:RagB/SusD family nutrient uptake outer membrane protein n=1 Tax=Bacteroides thetaiotaomicron TaxID=818 RepID=UPI002113E8AC|nr:RagB/SusD family nutrient uptake outer membrane protein [Bacteroides thetaiotaomicron]
MPTRLLRIVLIHTILQTLYLSLARINKVLEGVKKSGLEGAEVDVQVGELYALRALFHFDLARLFR